MDRINGAGTIDIGGGRRGFRSEDLPTGTEGTEVTDEWLNAVQENILKVIEEAGLALDVDNWSLLWQAIRFTQMADGYFSVTDRRNDPPGAPAVGDRYIVGEVPTGAWVGQKDKIALWLGAWAFIPPKPWMHVGFADRTDWRWDHTLGAPAWVPWLATADYAGPSFPATPAEVSEGELDNVFVSPLALKNRLAPVAVITSAAVGYAWSTLTNVTNLVGFSNDIPGLAIGASAVTFDAESAGLYSISLTATSFNAGVEVQMNAQTTGSNVAVYPVAGGDKNGSQAAIMGRSATHRFAAGDTLYFQLRQIINGGGSATLAARVTLTRLGA
jgi:hypothetical protein